jgi:hypothetical protein
MVGTPCYICAALNIVFGSKRRRSSPLPRRIALALRASDAQTDGATYFEIAQVMLPAQRISRRDWGTHEARDQIKRLVKTGLALVQGGYRALLRPSSRKK